METSGERDDGTTNNGRPISSPASASRLRRGLVHGTSARTRVSEAPDTARESRGK